MRDIYEWNTTKTLTKKPGSIVYMKRELLQLRRLFEELAILNCLRMYFLLHKRKQFHLGKQKTCLLSRFGTIISSQTNY